MKTFSQFIVEAKKERKSGDYSLRDWFSKSSGTDPKTGREVKGWVQLGGKFAGAPCAKQPGQKTKPKCGSSKMAAAMSKEEEEAAAKRKRRNDPNPDRRGKAKNVATEGFSDWRGEMTEGYMRNNSYELEEGGGFIQVGNKRVNIGKPQRPLIQSQPKPLPRPTRQQQLDNLRQSAQRRRQQSTTTSTPRPTTSQSSSGAITSTNNSRLRQAQRDAADVGKATGTSGLMRSVTNSSNRIQNRYDLLRKAMRNAGMSGADQNMNLRGVPMRNSFEPEGELIGEGEKDACYKKVKSRYKIWPSAYASGALVKCRKVGAKNWGNSSKNEEYTSLPEFAETQINAMSIQDEVIDESAFKKQYAKRGKLSQSSKRKSLGRGSSINPDAKPSGYESKKEFRKTEKNLAPYQEEVRENYTKIQSRGMTYSIMLNWKGKYIGIQIFFPQLKRPTKQEVSYEVEKIYPGARILTFNPAPKDPTKPLLFTGDHNWNQKK